MREYGCLGDSGKRLTRGVLHEIEFIFIKIVCFNMVKTFSLTDSDVVAGGIGDNDVTNKTL